MREMLKMIIVLIVLSALSGGLLAAVRTGTKERIENQQLEFVKGPAIRSILEGSSNDPISDRFKIMDKGKEITFFVGKKNGKPEFIAFETFGKGFGGEVGLMVGLNINNDKIAGVGVTTHSETPGVGAKAQTDPSFVLQFKGLALDSIFKVKSDGGQIDAISGATVTSKGVCSAVTEASNKFNNLKSEIMNKLKSFNN